jgi:hypothetical protein
VNGYHKTDIRHGGHTKIKNNDHFNLLLCLFWFLGVRRRANLRQLAIGVNLNPFLTQRHKGRKATQRVFIEFPYQNIKFLVTIHRRDRKDRREKPFREEKRKEKKECSATSAFARGESPPTGR